MADAAIPSLQPEQRAEPLSQGVDAEMHAWLAPDSSRRRLRARRPLQKSHCVEVDGRH